MRTNEGRIEWNKFIASVSDYKTLSNILNGELIILADTIDNVQLLLDEIEKRKKEEVTSDGRYKI